MKDTEYFVIIIVLIVLIFVFSGFKENYDSAQIYGPDPYPLKYVNFGTGEYEAVPSNGTRWI